MKLMKNIVEKRKRHNLNDCRFSTSFIVVCLWVLSWKITKPFLFSPYYVKPC